MMLITPSLYGSAGGLLYADGSTGPLREIQAGSGYWSQNSFSEILGYKGTPKSMEVKWFDGMVDTVALKSDKLIYHINH